MNSIAFQQTRLTSTRRTSTSSKFKADGTENTSSNKKSMEASNRTTQQSSTPLTQASYKRPKWSITASLSSSPYLLACITKSPCSHTDRDDVLRPGFRRWWKRLVCVCYRRYISNFSKQTRVTVRIAPALGSKNTFQPSRHTVIYLIYEQ